MATATNVSVGKPKVAGAIYVAPAGTALPTDASTDLAETFVSLGYISDAGVVNSENNETTSVKAWGGDTVLSALTGREDTWKMTFIEALNLDLLKEIYGSENVTGTLTAGIKVSAKAQERTAKVWVIEMILTDGALKRVVLPSGKITEIADVTYTDADAIGYEVTILAQPDSTGVTHYEHIKKA